MKSRKQFEKPKAYNFDIINVHLTFFTVLSTLNTSLLWFFQFLRIVTQTKWLENQLPKGDYKSKNTQNSLKSRKQFEKPKAYNFDIINVHLTFLQFYRH